jgi:hypothetical protein
MTKVRVNVSPARVYTFSVFSIIHELDFRRTSRHYAPKMVPFVTIAIRATNSHVDVECYVYSCFRCRLVWHLQSGIVCRSVHVHGNVIFDVVQVREWPPLWYSSQSSWLQIQRSRVPFPALPDLLRSSGPGTGSTQPREDNWDATWKDSSGSGLENRN